MTDFIAMFFDWIVSEFAWFSQTFVATGLMDIMSGLAIISLVFYRIVLLLFIKLWGVRVND